MREAQSSLAASIASESMARINLDYTSITAPISGRIGRRNGHRRQPRPAGSQTPLATIVSLDPIYCYFDADESSFLHYRTDGALGTGGPAGGHSIACELALPNEDGFPHRGRIDFFDNQVDANTGTIRMRAVLKIPIAHSCPVCSPAAG